MGSGLVARDLKKTMFARELNLNKNYTLPSSCLQVPPSETARAQRRADSLAQLHAHASLLSCRQKAGPDPGIKLVLCQIQYLKLVQVVPNVAGRGVPKGGSEQTAIKDSKSSFNPRN